MMDLKLILLYRELTLKPREPNAIGSLCLLSERRNRLWSVTYVP